MTAGNYGYDGEMHAQASRYETELREWAARIRSWPADRAWLYFNNDWEAFAVRNAERLRELLDEPGPSA